MELAQEPMNLLRERVAVYQAALEAGKYTEFYRDIELTLQRLATAGTLVDYAREGNEQENEVHEAPVAQVRAEVERMMEAREAPVARIRSRRRLEGV
jgi:hypothetical protein